MPKKSEFESVAVRQSEILKDILAKLPDGDEKNRIKAQIEESEKKLSESLGERVAIGPCFACKNVSRVKKEKEEEEKSEWFMCPHKEWFCPDCIRSNRRAFLKKRKEEKEKKEKKKDKDK